MNELDLTYISNNFYILLVSLNRHIFNPHELTKKLNLPISNIKVLFYLIHRGPTSVSVIAKDLCVSKPNMTPIIDKLVDDGLVIREYNPEDRRVIILNSTQKATELFKSLEVHIKSSVLEKISSLDKADLNEFSNSLDSLLRITKKIL